MRVHLYTRLLMFHQGSHCAVALQQCVCSRLIHTVCCTDRHRPYSAHIRLLGAHTRLSTETGTFHTSTCVHYMPERMCVYLLTLNDTRTSHGTCTSLNDVCTTECHYASLNGTCVLLDDTFASPNDTCTSPNDTCASLDGTCVSFDDACIS